MACRKVGGSFLLFKVQLRGSIKKGKIEKIEDILELEREALPSL